MVTGSVKGNDPIRTVCSYVLQGYAFVCLLQSMYWYFLPSKGYLQGGMQGLGFFFFKGSGFGVCRLGGMFGSGPIEVLFQVSRCKQDISRFTSSSNPLHPEPSTPHA